MCTCIFIPCSELSLRQSTDDAAGLSLSGCVSLQQALWVPFSTSVYLTLISKIATKALTSGRAAPHPLLQAEALTRARFYFARRMHIFLVFSFFFLSFFSQEVAHLFPSHFLILLLSKSSSWVFISRNVSQLIVCSGYLEEEEDYGGFCYLTEKSIQGPERIDIR